VNFGVSVFSRRQNIRAFVAKKKSKISFAELSRKRVRDRLFGRFKDSKIQKIQFRQDGYRIQKIFCEFWCFRVSVAKKFVHSWLKEFKDSRIQKFNSAESGIGFKKYFVAFCVSVFWWRQNIRAFVAKKFKNSNDSRPLARV
jgi:hypothetical protein